VVRSRGAVVERTDRREQKRTNGTEEEDKVSRTEQTGQIRIEENR
jgi:hypothetical protein